MPARSLPLVWMIVLALLLPLAGLSAECDDCYGAGTPGCCPPACSLCLCCGPGPMTLAGAPGMHRDPKLASLLRGSPEGGPLSADPRDVFHVPKTL